MRVLRPWIRLPGLNRPRPRALSLLSENREEKRARRESEKCGKPQYAKRLQKGAVGLDNRGGGREEKKKRNLDNSKCVQAKSLCSRI